MKIHTYHNAFFVFGNGTFSYLKMRYFLHLKVTHFRIWNESIFVFEADLIFVYENGTFFVFRNGTFSYLKKRHFLYLKLTHFRIWYECIFVFENDAFFEFEKDAFSYLKMTHFSFLKMPDFRIWNWHIFQIWNWHNFRVCNWHIFRIWNCHILRIWKRHISYFKSIDKVIWEMPALEMSSSEGARTNSKNLKCSFLSFKVSRFQIWGDKVTWGISTFEMLAFKV